MSQPSQPFTPTVCRAHDSQRESFCSISVALWMPLTRSSVVCMFATSPSRTTLSPMMSVPDLESLMQPSMYSRSGSLFASTKMRSKGPCLSFASCAKISMAWPSMMSTLSAKPAALMFSPGYLGICGVVLQGDDLAVWGQCACQPDGAAAHAASQYKQLLKTWDDQMQHCEQTELQMA